MATRDRTAPDGAPLIDTAPAGTLAALALLLEDLRTDADALRELLAGAEPTALHVVLRDALALMSWRLAFGQGIATDAADADIEAEALRRLLALLLAGVPFDDAVWDATDRGRDLDTARLLELYHQHRAARTADQGGKA